MNSNFRIYKSYIDERVKCYPSIHEMISFYKGLLDIWDEARPDDLTSLFSVERLSQGLFMLDADNTSQVDFKHSTDTAERIFKWMDLQKMKDAKGFSGLSRRNIEDFIRTGICGEDRFRNAILKWILKPSFYFLFSPSAEKGSGRFLERTGMSWSSAQCPVCNSPPGMALVITEREQHRFLSCCFCDFRWQFRIGICPGCANDNPDTFGLIVGEAGCDQGVRAVTCEVCKRYLKTIFIKCREDGKNALELDMDIEDVVTLPLDIMANQRGYSPICEK